jgi:hypothetical protein
VKWDCSIGGESFLFATNQQNPYRRETADFRRQRIDQEREVGEQSLDSGYWLRSQASFHMGAGIASTEPLSVPAEEARFRFNASLGVDPWTPGELKLLPDTVVHQSLTSTGFGGVLGVGEAVLSWSQSYIYKTAGAIGAGTNEGLTTAEMTNPFSGGKVVQSATTTGGEVVVAGAFELAKTDTDLSAPLALMYNGGSSISCVRWVKQRLIVCDGAKIIEITNLSPASPPAALPAAHYTHPATNWKWTDAAEGPEAIYVSGYASDTSAIYAMTLAEVGGVLELSTPTLVAEMPRGESVLSLYSYLGSFLIVGTTAGVRIAQVRSGATLALGPLIVETDGAGTSKGSWDAVAQGRYVWVTVGTDSSHLWRIDLGQPLDGDLRFASASDLNHDAAPLNAGVRGVSYALGRLWMWVGGVGLVASSLNKYRTSGWLETGRIRMGTLQPKAWLEATLSRVPDSNYVNSMEARVYTSAEESGPWSLVASLGPSSPASSKFASGAITNPTTGPDLYVRIELQPTLSGSQIQRHTPRVTGYQVSSIPAPARSRLVAVPVQMFDWERDRNGKVSGYHGYAWARLSALEAMESGAAVVTFMDHTTGESSQAYIERVTFTRLTPPFRGEDNAGGAATVLLRLIG